MRKRSKRRRWRRRRTRRQGAQKHWALQLYHSTFGTRAMLEISSVSTIDIELTLRTVWSGVEEMEWQTKDRDPREILRVFHFRNIRKIKRQNKTAPSTATCTPNNKQACWQIFHSRPKLSKPAWHAYVIETIFEFFNILGQIEYGYGFKRSIISVIMNSFILVKSHTKRSLTISEYNV